MSATPHPRMSRPHLRSVSITGVGSYVPDRVLTNAELERMVDTSDEWIRSRTGIRERRIAADDQATSDLAVAAARRALTSAGLTATDVDLIIVATITPDMLFPSTACLVQRKIGARRASALRMRVRVSSLVHVELVHVEWERGL